MEKFIKSSSGERKNIIQKAANDLGLRFDIVEKDIWVCYVLEKLFSNQKLKDNLIFKGGTCLSKAYGAIDRFSEDVDITINSKVLDIKESTQTRKGDQKYKKRNIEATRGFVENDILPILSKMFDDDLGSKNYELVFDETDKNNTTLFFQFPFPSKEYSTSGLWSSIVQPLAKPMAQSIVSGETINKGNYNYIKPKIKLEFGALGGVWPVTKKLIKPYAKEILSNYFDEFEVSTLDIKRNFIEKLLILHSIALRPEDKLINQNYSRHYYDVYSIVKKGLKINPESDLEILELVVQNKHDFWNESWVEYDKIKKFSDIKLMPNEARALEIKKDYKNMEEMFFGDFPRFDEMILSLREFEIFLLKSHN